MREGEGQAESGGETGTEAGGAEQPDRGAVRGLDAAGAGRLDRAGDGVDPAVGVAVGEVVVQEADQLGELLGEVVGTLAQVVRAPQGCRGGAVRAGARPRPRSTRPGAIASSVPNCSAMTSGAWFGSITPPEPRRMRLVCAARWARITAGDEEATPGMEWCSATQ